MTASALIRNYPVCLERLTSHLEDLIPTENTPPWRHWETFFIGYRRDGNTTKKIDSLAGDGRRGLFDLIKYPVSSIGSVTYQHVLFDQFEAIEPSDLEPEPMELHHFASLTSEIMERFNRQTRSKTIPRRLLSNIPILSDRHRPVYRLK